MMPGGLSIHIYEAGRKPLAKVAVTGGGHCNLTNTFQGVESLEKVYPRGFRAMKRALAAFSHDDTCRWFRERGVALKELRNGCIFPVSMDAMQIVRVLLHGVGDIPIHTGKRLTSVQAGGSGGFTLRFSDGSEAGHDLVLVTVGGTRSMPGLPEGITLVPPCPSLFSLKVEDPSLRSLMGTVASDATVGIAGTRFRAGGELLVTDWGVSGPAILRLSSYAARHLSQSNYSGNLVINWISKTYEEAVEAVGSLSDSRLTTSTAPEGLSRRLWTHILSRAGVRADIRNRELGAKSVRSIANALVSDTYAIAGRAPFRDEFVTAGGVGLDCLDISTFQARAVPGLFFAGEALDIDAVTGGFNLQAAWSTARSAANGILKKL